MPPKKQPSEEEKRKRQEETKRRAQEKRSLLENKAIRNEKQRAREAAKKEQAKVAGWTDVDRVGRGGNQLFCPPGTVLLGKLVANPTPPTGPAGDTTFAGMSDDPAKIRKEGTPPPETPPSYRISPLPSPNRKSSVSPRPNPRMYECSCGRKYGSQKEADNCHRTNHGHYLY